MLREAAPEGELECATTSGAMSSTARDFKRVEVNNRACEEQIVLRRRVLVPDSGRVA